MTSEQAEGEALMRRGVALLMAWVGLLALVVPPALAVPVTASGLRADLRPFYTTADNPANHVVSPGTGFDGVTDLIIATGAGLVRCSGSLLTTGMHVLTAAHCVDTAVSATAYFDLLGGAESRTASAFFVHPGWAGDVVAGRDLAIVRLASAAPGAAERFDIYRGSGEVGAVGTKAGYGRSGSGITGDVLPSGTKRSGDNRYDALADILEGVFFDGITPGTQLAYDFDSGASANDAFGAFFGLSDLGLGVAEVAAAPGDSGGPTFIGGLIAGVVSYGFGFMCFPGTPDVTCGDTDSSFGEMVVDTRVSAYAGWIDSVAAPVPEPTSFVLAALGGAGLIGHRLARRWKRGTR